MKRLKSFLGLNLLVLGFCTLLAGHAGAFVLNEVVVTLDIQHIFRYPVDVLITHPDLVGAKRLERHGQTVVIYKGPQTYQVDFYGVKTQLNNLTFSSANDMVVSDWPQGANPVLFGKNAPSSFAIAIAEAYDFGAGIVNICSAEDIGEVTNNLFASNITYMEVLHNSLQSTNVLLWDNLNRKMLRSEDQITDCQFDVHLHSDQNSIASRTGFGSAQVTAIAEDRSGTAGEFYVFDLVSGDILRTAWAPNTYTVTLTRAQILAVTGMASVDLSGSMTTDLGGNIYAWDRISNRLLYYRVSTGVLYRLNSAASLQALFGGLLPDIKDIDYVVAAPNGGLLTNALTLLDAATGRVFVIFRP